MKDNTMVKQPQNDTLIPAKTQIQPSHNPCAKAFDKRASFPAVAYGYGGQAGGQDLPDIPHARKILLYFAIQLQSK